MMAAASRETARKALAALFTTALTGAGNPVQSVYGYEISEFGGGGFESPVVLVLSSGTRRQRRGMGETKYKNFFRLEVLVFVSDAITDESWTDADVEDRLDLIEKSIADVLTTNRVTASWNDIGYEPGSFSRIVPATLGGHSYKMETLIVLVEVLDA